MERPKGGNTHAQNKPARSTHLVRVADDFGVGELRCRAVDARGSLALVLLGVPMPGEWRGRVFIVARSAARKDPKGIPRARFRQTRVRGGWGCDGRERTQQGEFIAQFFFASTDVRMENMGTARLGSRYCSQHNTSSHSPHLANFPKTRMALLQRLSESLGGIYLKKVRLQDGGHGALGVVAARSPRWRPFFQSRG